MMGKHRIVLFFLAAFFVAPVSCKSKAGRPAPEEKKAAGEAPALKEELPEKEPAIENKDEPAPSAWTRSGNAPTFSMIRSALGSKKSAPVKILGKPMPLGDGRFLCVTLVPKDTEEAKVSALVVSENQGKAQIESRVELPAGKSEYEQDPDDPDAALIFYVISGTNPKVPARKAVDLDQDGEIEAWLLLHYDSGPERMVGSQMRKMYYIIDVDPSAAVAFMTETSITPDGDVAAEGLTAKVKYKDLNKDGHDDIIVKGNRWVWEEFEEDDAQDDKSFEHVHLWDAKSDTWVKKEE